MNNTGEAANEHERQRNRREHREETHEALARDSELDADPGLAMSLEQLDEKIRWRRKFRGYGKGGRR